MRAGAALKTGAKKSDWTAVTIEGFLHKSVVSAKKNTLTIKASSGAALRASADPSAAIVAVVEDGATLDRVSANGEWFRVKRDGWVQSRDLKTESAKPSAAARVASGAHSRVAARAGKGRGAAGSQCRARSYAVAHRPSHQRCRRKPQRRTRKRRSCSATLLQRSRWCFAMRPTGSPPARRTPRRACASSHAITGGRAWSSRDGCARASSFPSTARR